MDAKKVFAAIGLTSIIAIAGVCVAMMPSGGDHPEIPGSPSEADASTDGLTKNEVQAKLQHYADLLNTDDGKTRYLVVSGSVHTFNNESSGVVGDCMIGVAPGSASVADGDLLISASETYTNWTGSRHISSVYACDYVVPYHAIVGIKIVKTSSNSVS
jgi:hypothetical protein